MKALPAACSNGSSCQSHEPACLQRKPFKTGSKNEGLNATRLALANSQPRNEIGNQGKILVVYDLDCTTKAEMEEQGKLGTLRNCRFIELSMTFYPKNLNLRVPFLLLFLFDISNRSSRSS